MYVFVDWFVVCLEGFKRYVVAFGQVYEYGGNDLIKYVEMSCAGTSVTEFREGFVKVFRV